MIQAFSSTQPPLSQNEWIPPTRHLPVCAATVHLFSAATVEYGRKCGKSREWHTSPRLENVTTYLVVKLTHATDQSTGLLVGCFRIERGRAAVQDARARQVRRDIVEQDILKSNYS
jgi:hypothetical protein